MERDPELPRFDCTICQRHVDMLLAVICNNRMDLWPKAFEEFEGHNHDEQFSWFEE